MGDVYNSVNNKLKINKIEKNKAVLACKKLKFKYVCCNVRTKLENKMS